jgi:hypothetical protein
LPAGYATNEKKDSDQNLSVLAHDRQIKMKFQAGRPMNEQKQNLTSTDNGGRRSGGDRRTYSYTMHFPERRSGEDRRKKKDRRKTPRYEIPAH